MNEEGNIVNGAEDPELGQDICTQIYVNMIRLNVSRHVNHSVEYG